MVNQIEIKHYQVSRNILHMLRFIFKQAKRNLLKQKQTTVINIIGMVVAISTMFIIMSWVMYEKSYDKHHHKADRIYRVSVETGNYENNSHWHFARTWQEWRRRLPDFFPEIEELVEMAPTFDAVVTIGENIFYERGFAIKPNFFNVFDIEFILGDPANTLEGEHTIIISESLAKKYFKNKDPLGETMKIKGSYIDEDADYTISGVYKNMPPASHFHSNFFVHYHEPSGMNTMEWAYTYLLLQKDAKISDVRNNIQLFIDKHVPEGSRNNLHGIHFTPLTDIHLKSHIEREIESNGDIKHVRLFTFVSIGIFIIALINFINLLMVSYGKRINTLQINKILGGKNRQNVLQLFLEAGLIGLVSLLISIVIFKPLLNILALGGVIENVPVNKITLTNLFLVVLMILFLISITGILPHFLLKFMNIKGIVQKGRNGTSGSERRLNLFNKPLLVVQFTISIIVIIASLILHKQNNFLLSHRPGNNNENIILLNRSFWSEENEVVLLRDEILKNPFVENYCAVMDEPSYLIKDGMRVKSPFISTEYNNLSMTVLPTDETLFEFFDVPFVAGRTMKPYIAGQKFEEYILNESAVKKLGFSSPEEVIGIDFEVIPYHPNIIHGGKVVGVVKDFNFTSLYHPIQPMVFFQKPIWQWFMMVKFVPGDLQAQIESVKKDWEKVYPEYPFDYEFLSNIYEDAYRKDILVNKLLNLFSILCVLISSIGLLGITSILLLNKTKEIGVRKVNGARIIDILAMLNKDFVVWIVVSFILACPVAWYGVNKWLDNFAYKTEISWWVFALAGILAIFIAMVTVSWRSWRVAGRNPVEALRYE